MRANPWKPVAIALLLMLFGLCAYDYLVTRTIARSVVDYLNEPVLLDGGRPISRAEILNRLVGDRVKEQAHPSTPKP